MQLYESTSQDTFPWNRPLHVLVVIDDAFLRQPDYVEAMITCLQAIEQNKASLLADVSPALVSASLERSVILMYRPIYDPTQGFC